MQFHFDFKFKIKMDSKSIHELREICKVGNLSKLKKFVKTNNLQGFTLEDGYTLYGPCTNGHLTIVKYLIDNFNIDFENFNKGRPRLDIDIFIKSMLDNCEYDILRLLISKKIIDKKDIEANVETNSEYIQFLIDLRDGNI